MMSVPLKLTFFGNNLITFSCMSIKQDELSKLWTLLLLLLLLLLLNNRKKENLKVQHFPQDMADFYCNQQLHYY